MDASKACSWTEAWAQGYRKGFKDGLAACAETGHSFCPVTSSLTLVSTPTPQETSVVAPVPIPWSLPPPIIDLSSASSGQLPSRAPDVCAGVSSLDNPRSRDDAPMPPAAAIPVSDSGDIQTRTITVRLPSSSRSVTFEEAESAPAEKTAVSAAQTEDLSNFRTCRRCNSSLHLVRHCPWPQVTVVGDSNSIRSNFPAAELITPFTWKEATQIYHPGRRNTSTLIFILGTNDFKATFPEWPDEEQFRRDVMEAVSLAFKPGRRIFVCDLLPGLHDWRDKTRVSHYREVLKKAVLDLHVTFIPLPSLHDPKPWAVLCSDRIHLNSRGKILLRDELDRCLDPHSRRVPKRNHRSRR